MEKAAPLDALTTSRPLGGGRFELLVPDGWQQGRGAFGGYVLASLIRAMEAEHGAPERPLRSITSELCGPTLPGPAELRVEVLRAGTGVSTIAARLVQNGEVQAHAVGVFGKQRATDRDRVALTPPKLTPWREVEVLPVQPPFGPVFAEHYEFRNTGPLPFSGHKDPAASGWIRPKNPGEKRDAAFIAACVDAWWPAGFVLEDVPRPMATVGFMMELCGTLEGLPKDEPLFHFAKDAVVRDGYIVEFRELWGADGRLVALNQQTIAIIK